MEELRIALLGSMQIVRGTTSVTDFEADAARALLAYLVMNPARPIPRRVLAGMLWPEWPDSDALRNLRSALYRLRQAIGDRDATPPYLTITRQTLQFNTESATTLDVMTFTDRVKTVRSHQHPRGELCPTCVQGLTEAAATYRGDFMDGFSLNSAPLEEWIVVQREAYHQQALWALDKLTAHYEANGTLNQALTYAQRQVALEPWREEAHRQWMRALALSGQRPAALAQYETCVQILDEELGIGPEPATQALYAQIREGALSPPVEPLARPAPTQPPPPPQEGQSPVLGEASEPERRLLTILVADVNGSESLLARTGIERWAEVMDGILNRLGAEAAQFGGEIHTRSDSGLIVYFGAQRTHEDDPERAVLTAQAMARAFEDGLRSNREESGYEDGSGASSVRDLMLTVGIDTGEAVVGGSETAPGASRVRTATLSVVQEIQTHVAPGTLWVGQTTHRMVASRFEWKQGNPVTLPESEATVAVFHPVRHLETTRSGLDLALLRSPLMGRETEFEVLQAAIADMQRGVGGVVTLVGEAGIGKSRLVAELQSYVEDSTSPLETPGKPIADRPRWIEGRCLSFASGSAYQVWQRILRHLFRIPQLCTQETECRLLEDDVGRVCPGQGDRLTPYLARVMALPVSGTDATMLESMREAGRLRDATFRAVETVLACAAAQRPTVLVLEDLHWADATSLALLEHLLALTDRMAVLFLCVFRPETTHGCWALRETASRRYPHRHRDLILSPLDERSQRNLLDNLLDAARKRKDKIPDPEILPSIVARAEGNPFFTEEILRSLIEDRKAASRHGEDVTARTQSDPLDRPYTVRAVLTMRIDRLPGAARRILQLASVVGRTFSYPVMKETTQITSTSGSATVLDEELVRLQRQQLIRERARLPERTYIFEHQLTLEAAYATLLHRKRRVLHRRVAQALESLYPDRIEMMLGRLAHHWEEAGDAGRAVAYLRRAGEQAASQYANVEAVGFFTRALRLLDPGDDEQRYAILLARDGVYELQGDRHTQDHDLDALATLADRSGDPGKQAEIAIRRALWGSKRRDLTTTINASQQALKLAKLTGNKRIEALSHVYLGLMGDQTIHDPEETAGHYEEALALARSAHLRDLEAQVLRQYGTWLSRDPEKDGPHVIQEALHIYQEIEDRVGEAEVTGTLGGILMGIGNLDRARHFSERALQLDREVGDRMEEGYQHGTLAQLSVWQSRFEEVRAHIKEAIQCAQETDTLLIESWVHLTWVILLDAVGDYQQADAINDIYKTLETQWDPIRHRAYHWVLRGLVAYHRGDSRAVIQSAEQALSIIEGAVDHRQQGWLPWMRVSALIVRAHAHAARGDLDAALDDYREALSIKIIAGARAVTNDARVGVARVAMQQGDLEIAKTQVEAILGFLESRALYGAMEPLRIRLTCYRVLDAAGDPRAGGVLETAHTLLMERAEGIEDEALRLSYLDNVRAHREIRRLWTARDASGDVTL